MANLQAIQLALQANAQAIQANAQAVQALQVQGAGGPGFAYKAAKALKPDVKLSLNLIWVHSSCATETGCNHNSSVRESENTCYSARFVTVRPQGM